VYLIDTNIWLERLLEQDRSREVHAFLTRVPSEQLCVTDFTFHSIGVVLGRLKRTEAFRDFVQDVFIDGAVMIVALKTESMANVIAAMTQCGYIAQAMGYSIYTEADTWDELKAAV
jgi:hypothetical protein